MLDTRELSDEEQGRIALPHPTCSHTARIITDLADNECSSGLVYPPVCRVVSEGIHMYLAAGRNLAVPILIAILPHPHSLAVIHAAVRPSLKRLRCFLLRACSALRSSVPLTPCQHLINSSSSAAARWESVCSCHSAEHGGRMGARRGRRPHFHLTITSFLDR